jgi:hypothetical protein
MPLALFPCRLCSLPSFLTDYAPCPLSDRSLPSHWLTSPHLSYTVLCLEQSTTSSSTGDTHHQQQYRRHQPRSTSSSTGDTSPGALAAVQGTEYFRAGGALAAGALAAVQETPAGALAAVQGGSMRKGESRGGIHSTLVHSARVQGTLWYTHTLWYRAHSGTLWYRVHSGPLWDTLVQGRRHSGTGQETLWYRVHSYTLLSPFP